MKIFYFLFAAAVFGAFCFLEYSGTSLDRGQRLPQPKYYSYRGPSTSSSSGGGGFFYSHK
ncbi:MAG: hypothetical protein WC314_09950 [Vulcanimicrobiota bacterium]